MKWNPQLSRRVRLRDLHYLLTVVQTGSMAKAATLLSVSQPVVSKVIADMEHILGERLLDRSPRGVEPTVCGRKLLASSFAIFDVLHQGVIEIEHLKDSAAGEISIGCNEGSTLGIVPLAIENMRRSYPRVLFRVVLLKNQDEQRQELLHRTIELSIGRVLPNYLDHDIETEVLFDEQYMILAGPNYPRSHRSLVELAELVDKQWIIPPMENLSGQLVADIFHRKGLKVPKGRVKTSSLRLTRRLLEQGPFLAMLPTSVVPASSTLRALPVPLPDLACPIGIVKLKNRQLSPVARLFIEAVRAAASQLPTATIKLPSLSSSVRMGSEF